MKHKLLLIAVLSLVAPSGAAAQKTGPAAVNPPGKEDPKDDAAAREALLKAPRVLFVNATQEGRTCVAPTGWDRTCDEAPSGRALSTLRAVELQVINRRFFTDYVVEITANTQVEGGRIRGLEEAASLSLSEPSLNPPPSKGAIVALEPRTATSIFAALMEETEAGTQEALLEADEAVVKRQLASFATTVEALKAELNRLLGTSSSPGATTAGAPTIAGVRDALTATLDVARTGKFAEAPYRSEEAFRALNQRVRDHLAVFRTLQRAVSDTRLPDLAMDAADEQAQLLSNVATFAANRRAVGDAVAMYEVLAKRSLAREALRREQVRAMFRGRFKSGEGANPAVDEAELNALTDEYLYFLRRGGFGVADSAVGRLNATRQRMNGVTVNDSAESSQAPAATNSSKTDLSAKVPTVKAPIVRVPTEKEPTVNDPYKERAESLRSEADTITKRVRVELPDGVAALNSTLGTLLARVNEIYDHSQSSIRLSKIVDLSSYSANTFGYAVKRIEHYERYVLTAAPGSPIGAGFQTPAAAPRVAAGGAEVPATAPPAAAKPPAPAVAPPPASDEPPARPETGEVVATGTFEIHRMDRAAVVAGFAFSSISQTAFAGQQKPADGSRPAGLYPVETSKTSWQPHVLLGLNYYLRPRDTYPEARSRKLSHLGVTAGLSLNELQNYFLGGLWEPTLGFNVGAGVHFGKTQALQTRYEDDKEPLPDATIPTFEKRALGFYFHAGLDLDIFRKVFGKATGVGTASVAKANRIAR